jgi:2-iminobutanoate/2-iminopropanoate deaminase
VLEAAGTGFEYVLKATVFLVDMRESTAMNEVYREYFPSDPPARSAIGVVALGRPELRVEIELIAVIPSDKS